MKKLFTIVFFTIGMMVITSHVNAQNKLGYVSTEELISIMPETAKADSNLKQFQAALIQSAQEKEAALTAAIEKFNRDTLTMSAAVKEVKRGDLQKMLQELQGEDQRIQQQLQQKQQELIGPINKKAFDAIQAVAKEGGYTYVFEKNALLVAPPGEDILLLVAKKLNIKVPGQAGTQTAPKTTPKQ